MISAFGLLPALLVGPALVPSGFLTTMAASWPVLLVAGVSF